MCSTDRHVYIIGSSTLHNELLAVHIEEKTRAICFIKESLCKIPLCDDSIPAKQWLTLYDCLGMSCAKMEELILFDAWKRPKGEFLALYNVKEDTGIEKSALNSGVRGILYVNDHVGALLKMMKTVYDGELWISRKLITELLLSESTRMFARDKNFPNLTTREAEILALLTNGDTNGMIADKMCISPHTVKTHVYNIFKKIKVPNRLHAAHWARV